MKKINFKKPKYILPLILLPFIVLFYVIIGNWHGKDKNLSNSNTDSAQLKGQINTNMPGVSKEIAGQSLKDKLEAYRDQFKGQKDFSAIEEMETDSTLNGEMLESNYSKEELLRMQQKKKMDSLQKILKEGQKGMQQAIYHLNMGSKGKSNANEDQTSDRFIEHLKKVVAGNEEKTTTVKSSYDEDMKAFRDQMAMVDSMGKAHGSETEKANKKNETIDPAKDPDFKPLHVSSNPAIQGSAFNTLQDVRQEPDDIRAMIDEEGKVQVGTRVRIKTMQDLYVGGHLLPKGSYIYGIVTGFQTSRINIGIKQIIIDKIPYTVNLELYDNDGYLGLYVPHSNFREFSKEIGTSATQGMSSITTSDNTNVTSGIVNKLFQTSTTTASKLLAKEKAWIKYDYNVFIKERKPADNHNIGNNNQP
ncbi:MAG: conjugative transposon protein TraM [Bacteroidetes bacterium]|nr:conjugative transposon protein TraM [Bacteroidota bacterium]